MRKIPLFSSSFSVHNKAIIFRSEMFSSAITISIFGFYFLQVVILPFQIWRWFGEKTDKRHLRFLLLTALFIGFNSISMYSISHHTGGDQQNFIFPFFIDTVVISCVYLFLLNELKTLRNDRITIPLLFLLLVFNLIWMLVDIDSNTTNSFSMTLTFALIAEVILIIAAIRLLSAAWSGNGADYTYLISSFVVASIMVLIPVMVVLGKSEAVRVLLVNVLYVSLAFTYMRKLDFVRNIENPSQDLVHDVEGEDKRFNLSHVSRKYDLTSKEQEIIMLMIEGYSNKQLAEHFFIAEGTARKHVSNIYSKIGAVKNRSELFSELGLPKSTKPHKQG